jgi:arylsulfatase A-like enzyme
MYDPARIVLPASVRQPETQLPPMMARWRRNRNTPWSLGLAAENTDLYRTYLAYYFGLVSEVDDCVGRILKALESEKLGDTIVIYASDHGDFAAGHGMIEKCALGHNVYEETLRVPFIVNYPKVAKKPAVRSDLVELVDLYPTVLDLAGLPRPSEYPLPGRSLVATLRDSSPLGRKYAISENWSQVAVIGERYKLGQWLEPPNPQYDYRSFGNVLFDRVSDPVEVRNLAGTEGVKTAEQDLRRYLREWSDATPARAKKLAAPNALKPPAQRKK